MSNSPGLWERVVGAPWAAGGWIVGTCPSCIACPCNELRWPEIDTACPWRALLIVEGTWAAEVVADICPLLPGTWWTPPLVCCNVVGLWCNVVGICAIPDGIWGTWGNWASSWLAYWHGVRGRLATEWAMLPACFRNRALRLLNHTWNTKTFCVSTVNSSLSNYLFSEKKNSSRFRHSELQRWYNGPFQAFDIMLDEKGEERKTKFENLWLLIET